MGATHPDEHSPSANLTIQNLLHEFSTLKIKVRDVIAGEEERNAGLEQRIEGLQQRVEELKVAVNLAEQLMSTKESVDRCCRPLVGTRTSLISTLVNVSVYVGITECFRT